MVGGEIRDIQLLMCCVDRGENGITESEIWNHGIRNENGTALPKGVCMCRRGQVGRGPHSPRRWPSGIFSRVSFGEPFQRPEEEADAAVRVRAADTAFILSVRPWTRRSKNDKMKRGKRGVAKLSGYFCVPLKKGVGFQTGPKYQDMVALRPFSRTLCRSLTC